MFQDKLFVLTWVNKMSAITNISAALLLIYENLRGSGFGLEPDCVRIAREWRAA